MHVLDKAPARVPVGHCDDGLVPDLITILLILIVLAVIIAVTTSLLRRRRSPGIELGDRPASVSLVIQAEAPSPVSEPDTPQGQVLALLTERPNEIYLFGPAEELEGYGSTLATAPSQIARYAAGLRVGTEAARSFAELSGRLVLVDEKTAAAIRAGAMMHDKAGEVLAIVKNANGKFSSIARLRSVGGLAASATSMTNALSAMALQAQLDRIERQLSALSDGIDTVNRELLREWHAQILGAQDMLREVYGTATRTGELTPANWAQIASIGQVVRAQINGDRDRLVAAVEDLERLAVARDLKQRMKDLDSRVDAVRSAHAALTESTRTWAQYSALRLWHFTVSADPTIEAYRQELKTFIESSHEDVKPLRVRASNALGQLTEARWTARARHPLIARRLPSASKGRLAILDKVNWQPLELRQPSKELVLYRPPER